MWLATAVTLAVVSARSGASEVCPFDSASLIHLSSSVWDIKAPDSNRHPLAASLFEEGSATNQTLSQLTRGNARSTADSASPELDALLGEIDKKMRPLNHSLLSRQRCSEMADALASGSASKGVAGPLLFHTGVVSFRSVSGRPDGIRKLRLNLLSFLATQDLHYAEIHFWADVGLDNPVLEEALRPILADKRYVGRVKVQKFDARREFTAAVGAHPTTAELFVKMYDMEKMPASKSDLQRSVVLNNYGGLWLDTDVLLVGDLSAVANQDWAYLGQDDFINGALLSVSKPRSAFIHAYLLTIAARGIRSASDWNVYRYGPSSLKWLFRNLHSSGTFHILPTCFFDGAWWGVRGSTGWDDFFSSVATKRQVAYIAPGPGMPYQTLAYHWHGRWGKPIISGSLADKAEKIYLEKLQLSV